MKNLSIVLNIVSLVLIGVLFFLLFKNNGSPTTKVGVRKSDSTRTAAGGTIAYFEMDTIERHYNYIKDVREQLKVKEQTITNELNNTKKGYMNRIRELQTRSASMSQAEGEAAQAEIDQMQRDLQQKEARLGQELQEQQFKLMQDIFKKIEEYLKVYNQDGRYAYILSHNAGDMIYFKDSLNDITSDLIKGLNDSYKK
jgi:outer membrane protein